MHFKVAPNLHLFSDGLLLAALTTLQNLLLIILQRTVLGLLSSTDVDKLKTYMGFQPSTFIRMIVYYVRPFPIPIQVSYKNGYLYTHLLRPLNN